MLTTYLSFFLSIIGAVLVQCTSKGMNVQIPKSSMPYMLPQQLILGGSGCHASETSTYFLFNITLDSCNIKMESDSAMMKYTSKIVTIPNPASVITRVVPLEIPISCIFRRRDQLMLGATFHAKTVKFPDISQKESSSFKVYLELTTRDGRKINTDDIVNVNVGEELFIRVAGDSLLQNGVAVAADKCYVTPTNDPNDPLNHTLIRNG